MNHSSSMSCGLLAIAFLATLSLGCSPGEPNETPESDSQAVMLPAVTFSRVQPELFGDPGAQPNAWADFDGDGDLDLFVGMRFGPNRLYRNDDGKFVDIAGEAGLADAEDTRAAAWGDYDADGDPDLYIGFPNDVDLPNRLYRNDGGVFTNVAAEMGVEAQGTTRQPSWVDYDGDSDLDLFVAFRDKENRMYRNDGDRFTDVTAESGLGDPRRTVGVVWFDADRDGDLDMHVSNQNGDEDGFFRNHGDGTFTDVAAALGMNWPDRGDEFGSVAPAVTDFDNDGDLDLFIAAYGPDVLWANDGQGGFTNVAPAETLGQDHHSTTAAWADVDHDGRQDLYVTAFLASEPEARDHLFLNTADGFVEALPQLLIEHGSSHGLAWADFDSDGDLDLAVANNNREAGTHHLYKNTLPSALARRSLQVAVVDQNGNWTLPGAEVELFDSSTGASLGARLVDTGGGYCSQGMTPVHFGLPAHVERVDVRVTIIAGGQRHTVIQENVDPTQYHGTWLTVTGTGS